MTIDFLLEEESAETALRNLVPKIIGKPVKCKYIVFQGKADLQKKLPDRLLGYYDRIHKRKEDIRIVVLIDEDREDCKKLKKVLESEANRAKLATKSASSGRHKYYVVNRIAIEELEAWFFGDIAAIESAYPKTKKSIGNTLRRANPDYIPHGTWETLERVLQRAGYHMGGLEKMKAAREISMKMNPNKNQSKSFCAFRDALRAIK